MIEKECFICHKIKPLSEFYVHKEMTDGHLNKCKECTKAYMRSRDTREYDRNRYHNNVDRYLKHKYYMMCQRCGNGKYTVRDYAKKGLKLTLEEWLNWCNETMPTFMALHSAWKASGYDPKLTPTIDRIDNSKGYELGNLQWLTKSANSRKGPF